MTLRLAIALPFCVFSLAAQMTPQDLIDAGHYRRAMQMVEARLQKNPADLEMLCTMAALKQLAGDLPAAETYAEKGIAIRATAVCHANLANILGEMAQKAGILHQASLGIKFKREADAALSLDPRLISPLRGEMMFYLHAPGIVGGDKAKAYATAEAIMKIDPVEGYFARIDLAEEEKRGAETEGLLRKAAEAQPGSYAAQMRLGNFCAANKKSEEAERHAREAIGIHPDRAPGYALLAVALVQQSKWPELGTVLTDSEKAVPDNLLPYFRSGNTCLAQKMELARAEQYFRKYLGQTPELTMPSPAAAHWRLGLVLEGLGRRKEAIAELQTSVKLEPNPRVSADLKRLQ